MAKKADRRHGNQITIELKQAQISTQKKEKRKKKIERKRESKRRIVMRKGD